MLETRVLARALVWSCQKQAFSYWAWASAWQKTGELSQLCTVLRWTPARRGGGGVGGAVSDVRRHVFLSSSQDGRGKRHKLAPTSQDSMGAGGDWESIWASDWIDWVNWKDDFGYYDFKGGEAQRPLASIRRIQALARPNIRFVEMPVDLVALPVVEFLSERSWEVIQGVFNRDPHHCPGGLLFAPIED